MCLGQTLDLNTQFITNPIPNTPVWTDISSGVPGTSISNNFTPINSGTYILRSTIVALNCPSDNEDITVVVNDIPSVTFSTISQICLGESLDLNFTLTGTAHLLLH